ncbi:MAG: prepilin peptidase [Bdellovibrionaceae bacterium]|nr:prepilin peptidase [Pseudobdellovibrionaceae bacterium]NUM57051.1 prepilin peptidase [Pseudobdellovibrionaceae bacterium]
MSFLSDFNESLWATIFFIYGCLFGSFGNVLIYRMPKNESVIRPRSYCYSCHGKISWFDNIPIVSWVLLRGKCRKCGASFSIRYPIVEFLCGALFSLAYLKIGFHFYLIEVLLFLFAALVSSFIDLDHMILPDEFTLSGIVIGLLGALLNPEREFMEAFLGVLMGGGFLWLLAYVYFLFTGKEGMGGGDIKLLAWIGAVIGWKAIPFVIMSSAILGSIVGILYALKSKDGLKTAIPFGPYLVLGAGIFIFYGKNLSEWYFNLFLPGF